VTDTAGVTLHDVFLAAARIARHVRRTPLERSAPLSDELGRDVYLKLECLQRTGSFKLRGALNRLLDEVAGRRSKVKGQEALDRPGEPSGLRTPTLSARSSTFDLRPATARGVLTCSAGNHGLGVAAAARLAGIPATVVVPENASPAKVAGLRRAGVELILHGASYDEAEARARELAETRGLTFVSPYNDPAVIAGAGTVALEVMQELPEAATIVVPVGGGGLAAGVGLATKAINPAARVVGAQSDASPAMHAALAAGRLVPVGERPSLADGLAGNVEAGSITFPLVRRYLDEVVLVDEEAIAAAMLTFLDRHHLVVEGAGAVGLAALQRGLVAPADGPIVLIVSGGNVASGVLAELLSRRLES
jgi:threonine dehydratase